MAIEWDKPRSLIPRNFLPESKDAEAASPIVTTTDFPLHESHHRNWFSFSVVAFFRS
jgi:hypothetical protein